MSRRFNSRHGKVAADPNAKPQADVVLDDENSFVDPTQSDRRIPNELNGRFYARAGSAVQPKPAQKAPDSQADREASRRKKADAAAAKLLAARQAQADAEAELADLGL